MRQHQQGGDESWGKPLDDPRHRVPVEDYAGFQARHDVPASTAPGNWEGGEGRAIATPCRMPGCSTRAPTVSS